MTLYIIRGQRKCEVLSCGLVGLPVGNSKELRTTTCTLFVLPKGVTYIDETLLDENMHLAYFSFEVSLGSCHRNQLR